MDVGGIFGIMVIIFVVIGLYSAAAQDKKKKQDDDGRPAPRPTMSDIQRAFMMMAGIEEEEEKPKVQSYSQTAEPVRAYNKAQPEDRSDFASMRPGSMADYVPFSDKGSNSLADYTPPPPGSLAYTPLSHEGLGGYTFATETVKEAEPTVIELQESLGEVNGADLSESDGRVHHKGPTLKLFQDKNDYVRAVIYSEILARRPGGRRA